MYYLHLTLFYILIIPFTLANSGVEDTDFSKVSDPPNIRGFNQVIVGKSKLWCAKECSTDSNCDTWAWKKESHTCYLKVTDQGDMVVNNVQVYRNSGK